RCRLAEPRADRRGGRAVAADPAQPTVVSRGRRRARRFRAALTPISDCLSRRLLSIVRVARKSPSHARERAMSLTLEEANRILRGALAKAQQLNIKVSAAVCDAGGRLIALQRMDNAIWASVYGSQGKAVASAAFGRTSGEMAARADQPTPRGIAAAEGGHMIMGQGAVPIIRNGVVEGACGVGGGTSQEDEDCARAGVEQL